MLRSADRKILTEQTYSAQRSHGIGGANMTGPGPKGATSAPPSGLRQLAALLRSAGEGHPRKNGEALFSWRDP